MSDYVKETWTYEDDLEIERLCELLRSKKSMTVIKHKVGDGVILVGDDFESEEQANKILEALNG